MDFQERVDHFFHLQNVAIEKYLMFNAPNKFCAVAKQNFSSIFIFVQFLEISDSENEFQ